VGRQGAKGEIWLYGLRNPWRFSFDRQTNDLWIGDVGQNALEEIDFCPAGSAPGANFGWAAFEGTRRNTVYQLPPPSEHVPPVHEYPTGDGCAVTGGYVYRGPRIPALQGFYLMADFCNGKVVALRQEGGKVVERRSLGLTVESLASFGQDAVGELYALSLSGGVFRFDPA
jgi:glucose/arabinose dehydrogenase